MVLVFGLDGLTIQRSGRQILVFAFVRSAIEASQRKAAAIVASETDVSAYELVILGTPVWAGEIASPLRAYVEREREKLRKVAFFCTLGGANDARALAGMRAACGIDPIAELLIDAPALKSGAWRTQVDEFARTLRASAPTGDAAGAFQSIG